MSMVHDAASNAKEEIARVSVLRSLKQWMLGCTKLGGQEDKRTRRVHLRRRIQLWSRYRLPHRVRTAAGTLVFLTCELFFRVMGCRGRGGEIRKILLIRLDHIGDLLMATPAIRALRRAYPHAEIIGVAGNWAAPAAWANPHLDDVIIYNAVWFDRRARRATNLWRRALTRLALI